MKFLKIAGKDIRSIAKNRFIRVSVIAILIVPLLYSLLYLAAFWDPYSKLQEVPVAIVNLDNGATLEGENVNYGKDILDELKENKELGWTVTNLKDANEGLDGDKFYAKVVIPENFSSEVVSAKDGEPKEAIISFTCNDKKNFLASQINSKVQSELKAKITKTISSNYVEVAFDNLYKAKDGFVKAAEGSTLIYDGLNTLNEKVPTLSNGVTALSDGSAKLTSGQEVLNGGLVELNTKLIGGASDLGKLSDGAKKIGGISSNLVEGGQTLSESVEPFKAGGNAILSNYDKINTAYSQINSGVNELASNVNGTMSDINSIGSNIKLLLAKNPALMETKEMQDILKTLKKMDDGKEVSKEKITALTTGSNNLKVGMDSFKSGLSYYKDKAATFADGANTLAKGSIEFANGASELSKGTISVVNNLGEVQKGVGKLSQGSNELVSGQKVLNDGINTLKNTIPELKDGVYKLADGSKELNSKLNEGATEMKNGLVNSSQVMGDYVSQPLNLKSDSINPVNNYGTGFAPYFIPLSLWIGAIMMFFVIPSKVDEEENATRFDKVIGKFLSFGVVGVFQAILVSMVVMALGLKPTSITLYFITNIFLSLVFIAIIQCFIFLFGDAGRLISIVLLILQLTSCAGTFPLEVVPNFFKIINPFMPFTYAVEALREVISATTINNSVIINDFLILGSVLVVFLTVSIVFKNIGEKITEAIEGKKAA